MEMRSTITADHQASEPCMDPPPTIGSNERRMHVRAYNYWASLLDGRDFPSIQALDPSTIGDFGPHGVLLDFTVNRRDPTILWLGDALREEGRHEGVIRTLADVPSRSLLARLTDHFDDVVANRAPIGFEAEFVNARGNHALYRGILMPFSSNGTTIDFIYGVINWKEVADAGLVAEIAAEAARAPALAPRPSVATAVWADGPGRPAPAAATMEGMSDRAERLAAARDGVELARSTQARARTALYRALGLTYDALLVGERDKNPSGARARIRALVRDVFGPEEPARHRLHYAAVLAHALRTEVVIGGLRMVLEQHPDGLRGMIDADRRARRAAAARS